MNDLYKMQLGSQIYWPTAHSAPAWIVLRVPGGWLFTHHDDRTSGRYDNTQFIPFNNEFQDIIK